MTVPVGELVSELRREREAHVPRVIKEGRAMPECRAQMNLLWIIQGLAEDSPLEPLWLLNLAALSLPCHDHRPDV